MPGTLRALATIFAAGSLAFATPALADDWQGNDWQPSPSDGQTWDPGSGDPAGRPETRADDRAGFRRGIGMSDRERDTTTCSWIAT